VALELAYRMLKKYPHFFVLWVPAISRETFESAYREIGTLLRIPGITDDNTDVKQLVKNELDSGGFGDWLMIIDNADDPSVLLDSKNDGPRSDQLYDYLPRSDRGSILFTTRGRKAAERLTPSDALELGDLKQAEAKQLIAQRISNKALLNDHGATSELLQLLTYLPLAIVQAVAFINSNQVSIPDYLLLFRQADTEIEVFSDRFDDPSRYKETESTIAKTWQVSFDQIFKQDRLAADYLSFMACVARVNIPRSLLPSEGTAVQQFKALGTLTGYAFISERQQDPQRPEEERFFDVHHLVQKATMWWLREHNEWSAWTEKAYFRLEELVPLGGHEGKQKWIGYLPHAMHVSDLHSELSETGRASLLDRIGRCQATLGQYAAAEATHLRMLALRRKNLGDEHTSTLTSMNEVGFVLRDQGRYKEADAMHRQTLALREKVLGKEHPDTLTSINNLAGVLLSQGKYEEAETTYREMLALVKKIRGNENPLTLTSMNNLAGVLLRQGKYKEAKPIYRQTLALREKVFGKEHPSTLNSINNLALLLDRQGKYEEAETMFRQTLALTEKVLSKEHPNTLISINNLAGVLLGQGKYEEAETMYRQTLALREKVLGKEHPDTLTSIINLAGVLVSQGKYEEAETMYWKTLALMEKVLGKEHPSILTSMNNLAHLLDRQGKYEEAETMYRQTLALKEKVLGKEHPDTLTSINNLAGVLVSQGKCEQAETMYWQTLALKEKVLGKEHPSMLKSMNNLALLLDRQDKYEEAETMQRQTLALREKVLGKEHPDTLESVYNLAYFLAERHIYIDATTLYQRACEGFNVVLGDDHSTALACRRRYSKMLQRKEQSEPTATNKAPRTMPSK
jgi:tetratricopeptide (TPR) repeat protein